MMPGKQRLTVFEGLKAGVRVKGSFSPASPPVAFAYKSLSVLAKFAANDHSTWQRSLYRGVLHSVV